ncbi:MAG: Gfo/Idh/MocA family oxidoreductase [Anaerolineae bacterium]|nr:Gfo/Idh/MocA family oxidoreductase [Anaerolineae bacterium]
MKNIGFIDLHIDEFHSNTYARLIPQSTQADRFRLALAWEKAPGEGKKSLEEWCREHNVGVASSLEQVVEECDCLAVLAPSNPEVHEELADLPLRSGKPVYVDKTFAPSLAAAKRMFDKAEQHGTPLMSSSALRFGSAIQRVVHEDMAGKRVSFVATRGGGRSYEEYSVHMFEMMVMAIGTGATRLMQVGNDAARVTVVDYPDGRRGCITQAQPFPFQFAALYGDNQAAVINEMPDFYPGLVEAMLRFFDSGKPEVPKEQTLEIMALVEAGVAALNAPDRWVDLPK